MKGDAKHIPHVETGAYPLRVGNQVEALVDGENAFRSIARAVVEARQSVWVTVTMPKPVAVASYILTTSGWARPSR